jgi:hypothetical protein
MCQALVSAIAEQDYGTLSAWFGSGALSAGNQCRVTLQRLDSALAENFGWRSDGTTQIIVSQVDGVDDAAVLTDETGMRLVAELSEVSMSWRGQAFAGKPKWNAGWSNGEGLSLAAACELHPLGAYQNAPKVFVTNWLDGSRDTTFLATPEQTDKNISSYGASALFIYYLRYQLGFSWEQICQSTGTSLAASYAELTGRTDAEDAFVGVFEQNYPAGAPSGLNSNNPFPLQERGNDPRSQSNSGALSSSARTPNRLDVFWIGPDGGIGSTAWEGGANNNAWEPDFPITPPGAARL